jgi:hypothetical protein
MDGIKESKKLAEEARSGIMACGRFASLTSYKRLGCPTLSKRLDGFTRTQRLT